MLTNKYIVDDISASVRQHSEKHWLIVRRSRFFCCFRIEDDNVVENLYKIRLSKQDSKSLEL